MQIGQYCKFMYDPGKYFSAKAILIFLEMKTFKFKHVFSYTCTSEVKFYHVQR